MWKALTDPNELAKWFPLSARVTPGKGGKIFLWWGPGCEGEAEIVAWEPNKHFASKEQFAVIEWTLESRGGKTILRLVQSGFSTGAGWENEWFESTACGWVFMLLSLQWSLEKHPGEDRLVAWPRHKTNLSRSEVFRRLLQPNVLFYENSSSLKAEDSFRLTARGGETRTGRVEFLREDRGFCLSVNELNDALFWVTIEGAPGSIEAQIWVSAFSLEKSTVERFENTRKKRLQETFPDSN